MLENYNPEVLKDGYNILDNGYEAIQEMKHTMFRKKKKVDFRPKLS